MHIAHLEKPLYKSINKTVGYECIAKGSNANKRGDMLYNIWKGFKDPVGVGMDASRFD